MKPSEKKPENGNIQTSENLNISGVNKKNSKRHELLPLDDCYLELVNLFLHYAGPFLTDVISNLNSYRQHCINNNITPVKQLPVYIHFYFIILSTHRKPREANHDSVYSEFTGSTASLPSMSSTHSIPLIDGIPNLPDSRFFVDSSSPAALALQNDSGDINLLEPPMFDNLLVQQRRRSGNSKTRL